jgi:ATP-dependent Zn protease
MVVVPVPDLKGRIDILTMYAKRLVLDSTVDMQTLARRTAGMTGADLFNILNIAAVRSSADNLPCVPMSYLEEAFDRVVVGLERRNPMSEEEKRLTAYHEGGHTLVSLGNPGADPVHKATIMPRGQALGVTWSIPDREKYSEHLFELQARLEVLMGGKAAEELIFGPNNVTAGCVSDLQQATGLARRMVMNFGMAGAELAPIYMDMNEYASMSDVSKHQIDVKTQELLNNAYHKAMAYLKAHEQQLHRLAEALIEMETLSKEEIDLAIGSKMQVIRNQRKEQAEASAAAKEKLLERQRAIDRQAAEVKEPRRSRAAKPRPKEPEPEEEDE